MPDIKIRVEGGDELRRKLSDPKFIKGPLKDFLHQAAFVVEANMKQKAVVDTGRLRASITSNVEALQASIGPSVHYAPYVEFGTRPHWPPKGALQPWAGRHGFPTGPKGDFIMRMIIAKRGTKAHPFAKPAAQKSIAAIKGLLTLLGQQIAQRWNRRA